MFTPPSTFEVREAQDSEIEGAIEALSDAFQTDPVMSMAVGGSTSLVPCADSFAFKSKPLTSLAGK